jgi:hypothetical protein
VNRRAHRAGDQERDDYAQQLIAVVAHVTREDHRQCQGDPHPHHGEGQLSTRSVDREPRDRDYKQRVEDTRRTAASVAEQGDDDEVGEREDRLWPGRQSRPGHQEHQGHNDRHHRGCDRNPRVGKRETGHRDQGEGEDARRDERGDAPAHVRALEEATRLDVEANRPRPAAIATAIRNDGWCLPHSPRPLLELPLRAQSGSEAGYTLPLGTVYGRTEWGAE